ncbi:hypothetical protein AGMMS49975_07680 [Clostridia bacterium]|nr:hypothetical protein AGMMS49975_07680 [Clostridia bacterium]
MKRILHFAGTFLMLAAFVFIIKKFMSFEIDWREFAKPEYLAVIALLSLLHSFSVSLGAFSWVISMRYFSGKQIPFVDAFYVYAKSNLGKYLPGNVMHYANRQIFGTAIGLKQSEIALSSVSEIIYIIVATVVVSAAFGGRAAIDIARKIFPDPNLLVMFWAAALAGVVFILLPWLIFRKNKVFTDLTALIKNVGFLKASLKSTLICCVTVFILGLSLFAVFSLNAGAGEFQIVVASSSVSWIIGFLTPGVPGGIGIRETVLTLMLSGVYSAAVILLAAVTQRVIMIFGELLAFGIAAVLNIKKAA